MIDPNAPASKMTIRLEIATRLAEGLLRSSSHPRDYPKNHLASNALELADELIEWANRE